MRMGIINSESGVNRQSGTFFLCSHVVYVWQYIYVESIPMVPLSVPEQRDPKGLYKNARRGRIPVGLQSAGIINHR